MYVGVDLDATSGRPMPRVDPRKGPKGFNELSQLNIPLSSGAGSREAARAGNAVKRTSSFTPPSSRLTQPTKSQQRRKDIASERFGIGEPAKATGGRVGSSSARGSSGERKQRPQSARLSPGPFGSAPSSRSRAPSYSARVSAHERTHSPSGRYHPDKTRRLEIRSADISANIDYYAPHGAPDNDRKSKEASWLCSQAFIESLRAYPDPFRKSPIVMPGESIAFDGNTQSARRPHTEHVETAMRRRLSIAPNDDGWTPDQLPVQWPYNIPEGKWRSVGPISRSLSEGGPTPAGFKGGGFFSRSSRAPTGGGGLSSRASSARYGRSNSARGMGSSAGSSHGGSAAPLGGLFSR